MKTSFKSLAAVAAITALFGLTSARYATADQALTVPAGSTFHVGPQVAPPAPREDHRWENPDQTAVWVAGHYEWKDSGYVWVGGYYSHPPQGKSRWVSPVYSQSADGYVYVSGHWSE